jgi:hypothetical protein
MGYLNGNFDVVAIYEETAQLILFTIYRIALKTVFEVKAVHKKSCENVSIILQWISQPIWPKVPSEMRTYVLHLLGIGA